MDLLAWPVICATACCTICHFGIANIAPVSSQKEKIKKVEQERSNHCYYFTHKHWKDMDNYDFYLKSDFLGIDASINLLSDMIERREIK